MPQCCRVTEAGPEAPQGAHRLHEAADPRAGARIPPLELPDQTAKVRDRSSTGPHRETGQS